MTILINRLKKLIKARYYYSIPKKSKILFFDGNNIEIVKKQFKKNDYEILNVRGEKLNMNIILKMLLNFKFSLKYYIYLYIKAVKPKIVITFTDNSIFFYQFKKFFPKIKFIAIQNGYRRKNIDVFEKLKKIRNPKKKLQADHIFTFGQSTSLEYSKYIDAKNIVLGSFRNNLVPTSKIFNNKKSILFISQFRKADINKPDYYCTERKLLPIVANFCQINNLSLSILGTEFDDVDERRYFNEILSKFKFNFIKKKSPLSNYKIVDKFSLIVFIDSTLGYEAFARNRKIAVFSTRKINFNHEVGTFGWPKYIKKNGFFYSNKISEKEVFRVLKNVFFINNSNWKKKSSKIMDGVISYNLKNKKFFEIVNKYA